MYVVKKNKKFMTGHSYSTLEGYSFKWSKKIKDSRKINYDIASGLAILSKGTLQKIN